MRLDGFNAETVDPNTGFDPLPADNYTVVITGSEEKPTKAKTGSFLELKMEVIEGQYKGRLLFDRLNLNNPNQQAVDIAQATLSAICRAVGVMMPNDSSDLHDKPLSVKVVVKPVEGQYQASNEVKGYSPASDAASTPKGNTSSGAASTPPWKK